MAVLDKDRPRGLRVPSLSAIKAFNSKNKSSEPPTPPLKESIPPIQLPAPSQFAPRSDSIPVRPPRPLEKELPPNPLPPLPSPPPQPAVVTNPLPPVLAPAPAPVSKPRPDIAVNRPQPGRNVPPPRQPPAPYPAYTYVPAPAPAPAPGPISKPVPKRPVPQAAPPAVRPVAVQQRTPPSSEGEPEQRHSSGTEDSLEGFIPDPEPEPELDGSSGPNEPSSNEEDDRPWTPPEVEPVVVPLNNMHYNCYQDHRAMHKANNVWYSLPCMTCQKFDREIRRRCVFCCLRVCVDCFQKLQKCPNRSLTQLMENLSKEEPEPSAKELTKESVTNALVTIEPST